MSYLKIVERQPPICGTSNNVELPSYPESLYDFGSSVARTFERKESAKDLARLRSLSYNPLEGLG